VQKNWHFKFPVKQGHRLVGLKSGDHEEKLIPRLREIINSGHGHIGGSVVVEIALQRHQFLGVVQFEIGDIFGIKDSGLVREPG
jgi:hypothetical protein